MSKFEYLSGLFSVSVFQLQTSRVSDMIFFKDISCKVVILLTAVLVGIEAYWIVKA